LFLFTRKNPRGQERARALAPSAAQPLLQGMSDASGQPANANHTNSYLPPVTSTPSLAKWRITQNELIALLSSYYQLFKRNRPPLVRSLRELRMPVLAVQRSATAILAPLSDASVWWMACAMQERDVAFLTFSSNLFTAFLVVSTFTLSVL